MASVAAVRFAVLSEAVRTRTVAVTATGTSVAAVTVGASVTGHCVSMYACTAATCGPVAVAAAWAM